MQPCLESQGQRQLIGEVFRQSQADSSVSSKILLKGIGVFGISLLSIVGGLGFWNKQLAVFNMLGR